MMGRQRGRCRQVQYDACRTCKRPSDGFKQTGIRCRIFGSSCHPAFYGGHQRIGSDTHWHRMCLRKIGSEGLFTVLTREHGLPKVKKKRHFGSNRGMPLVRYGLESQKDCKKYPSVFIQD